MRDFEDMVRMYEDDPEAFDRERQEIIDDFIENLPNEECRLRMRQFQFRIDSQLRKYKDPVARMNKMVELFWEGFKTFQETLHACATGNPMVSANQPNAEILPFYRK